VALAQIEISTQEDALFRRTNGFGLESVQPEAQIAEWLVPDLLPPQDLPEAFRLGAMAGRSPVMQHLFARMRCTAPHFRLATVEGEPGAGKMLAARTLHRLGPSASGPFAPWVAAEFLSNPVSLWKDARGGLLYLARIEELSAEQQRLLRDFLERAAHERIRIHTACGPLQLVTGSLQPLRRLSAAGSFRADLASHLTAIRFALPPLRERRDDIPLLAGLFLRRISEEHHKSLRGFAPGALARLTAHSWPGNVRELESIMAPRPSKLLDNGSGPLIFLASTGLCRPLHRAPLNSPPTIPTWTGPSFATSRGFWPASTGTKSARPACSASADRLFTACLKAAASVTPRALPIAPPEVIRN
jgi:Sigma-54 interaction domain